MTFHKSGKATSLPFSCRQRTILCKESLSYRINRKSFCMKKPFLWFLKAWAIYLRLDYQCNWICREEFFSNIVIWGLERMSYNFCSWIFRTCRGSALEFTCDSDVTSHWEREDEMDVEDKSVCYIWRFIAIRIMFWGFDTFWITFLFIYFFNTSRYY